MPLSSMHEEMAEEDHIVREAVKRAAYEFESHDDPRNFQAHIEEILEGSKARQREIFARHWQVQPQPAGVQ